MERYKKSFLIILVLLPVILAFKNFWEVSNPLVWGDAPYFFEENLRELFNKPFTWDLRNTNFGGPQLLTLWLYIPTFLMGLLYYFFGFSHEISIRLVFYLPFLIFGISGIWLTLSHFKLSNLAKSYGVLFYTLNTYSILLIDGGQIGVLLSYGLFPFCFYLFLNLLKKLKPENFYLSLLFHFLIFNTDLRIALILVLFEIIWWIFLEGQKKLSQLMFILVYLLVILLSGFWVIPFYEGLQDSNQSTASFASAEFIHLTNSFYLFQPHFPDNDFGNLNKTPIYFIFLPFIFFLGLLRKQLLKQTIILSILFLVFVFLAKGANAPLGEIYNFLVNSIPLGSAFRDSSKFYIPAIFICAILIGSSIEFIKGFKNLRNFWLISVYLFLVISVYPVFTGGLTGILGQPPDKNDFYKIRDLIKQESGFRSLWFSEKPSIGFADWSNAPLSANTLFQQRPFASMIDGDYDLFGFLHNKNISEWYELLGVKYILYPPYEREKSLSQKEKWERRIFENFISKIPDLNQINLPIPFPVYETKNPMPKIFAQQKVLFVAGGDEVYQKLFEQNNFELEKNSTVFLESCKFNPEVIFNIKPESFGLILTDDLNDLYLSFFCNNFLPVTETKIKQWAINDSSKYLNWKAQLLERGIRNYDYDFNKGLAYSTKEGESLEFWLKVPEDKNYYLPVRFLTATESAGLKINLENSEKVLKSKNPHRLQWELIGPLNLGKGEHTVTLTNLGGLAAVNTLGLIEEDIFDTKKQLIGQKLSGINHDILNDPEFFDSSVIKTNFWQMNPAEYQVQIPKNANWIVFSEKFDDKWSLESYSYNKQPLPFYSMINGHYIGDVPYGYINKLHYRPQKYVNWGLLISLVTFSIICFAAILHIILKDKAYGIFKKYFFNHKN